MAIEDYGMCQVSPLSASPCFPPSSSLFSCILTKSQRTFETQDTHALDCGCCTETPSNANKMTAWIWLLWSNYVMKYFHQQCLPAPLRMQTYLTFKLLSHPQLFSLAAKGYGFVASAESANKDTSDISYVSPLIFQQFPLLSDEAKRWHFTGKTNSAISCHFGKLKCQLQACGHYL